MTGKTHIIAYKPEHLPRLILQEAQAAFYPKCLDPVYAESLAATGIACTAMRDDRILACAGIKEEWEGRGTAWALLSKDIGASMIVIHRAIKMILAEKFYRRVEAAAAADFEEGRTWLAMLGFIKEVDLAAGYMPDGRAATLYAWTSKGG